MTTSEELLIKKVATNLDEVEPDWFNRIDTDKLFSGLGDAEYGFECCVLEQVFEAEAKAAETSGFLFASKFKGIQTAISGDGKAFWPDMLFEGTYQEALKRGREAWKVEVDARKAA